MRKGPPPHMAAGLQKMAQGFQQMAQGAAKPVDFEQLKSALPEVGGWTRANPRGEQVNMPVAISRAEARYTKDNSRVELEIVDTALSQLLLAPVSMFLGSGYSERSDDGFKRAAKIGGQPGFEEWNTDNKRGEVTAVVGEPVHREGHRSPGRQPRDGARRRRGRGSREAGCAEIGQGSVRNDGGIAVGVACRTDRTHRRQPGAGRLISTRALRRSIEAAYNLDHDVALAEARAAVAAAPNESSAHRALAAMLWLDVIFRRGTVTVDHYVGGLGGSPRTLPKPAARRRRRVQTDRPARNRSGVGTHRGQSE